MFKLRTIICGVVLGAIILPFSSCKVVEWVNEQNMVLTTLDQVQQDKREDAIILPTEKIPEKYRESWKDEVVVMAPEDALKVNAVFVPVSTEEEDWGGDALVTVAQSVLRAGTTFFPWLAGFEGLLLLLFRRKRQHYSSALKSLAPTGEGINLKEGVMSVGRALGMVHSSEATKDIFEEELEEDE
jgi:hypothetical protein